MKTTRRSSNRRVGPGALGCTLVLLVAACDSGLTDVNVNPNSPTDLGAEFLLPQSIRTGAEVVFGTSQMLTHTVIWPQHAVQIQFPAEEFGNVNSSRMEFSWDSLYASALTDAQAVVSKGQELAIANHEGVGLVWRSWLFHAVTDLWGDVPYSEALQGAANSTPAYDAQQDIYAGLIADLTTATGLLDPANRGFTPAGSDILYGGDIDQWERFANSLRMRLAMRMSEVDAIAAEAAFVAAWNAGGFSSNADNAMLAWPGSPYENPVFENWATPRDDHGVSATMVDTLVSLNDPRLELYAEPAQSDMTYRGYPNGLDVAPVLNTVSRIGDFWRADGADSPTMVMTYSEVLFLAAEAAERGWIADDPATLYADAITANLEQYSGLAANAPTAGEITAYLGEPAVVYAGGAAGLDQIHLQQWIGLYMNGLEAWSHVRRTDVPALVPGPDMAVSRTPVRFTYPPREQSVNGQSYSDAVARQGPDDVVTTVWWDVN